MSKVGKIVGIFTSVLGASSIAGSTVYAIDNPDLVKDYINGNETYSSQQIVESKNMYEGEIAKIQKDVVVLNNSIEENKKEIATLETEVSTKTNELETAQSRISELNSNNEELNTQLETALADSNTKAETIESLQNQIAENNSEIEELESSISEKETTIAGLNSQITTLNNENTNLQTEVNNNLLRISTLENQVEELENLNNEYEVKISELESKFKDTNVALNIAIPGTDEELTSLASHTALFSKGSTSDSHIENPIADGTLYNCTFVGWSTTETYSEDTLITDSYYPSSDNENLYAVYTRTSTGEYFTSADMCVIYLNLSSSSLKYGAQTKYLYFCHKSDRETVCDTINNSVSNSVKDGKILMYYKYNDNSYNVLSDIEQSSFYLTSIFTDTGESGDLELDGF